MFNYHLIAKDKLLITEFLSIHFEINLDTKLICLRAPKVIVLSKF